MSWTKWASDIVVTAAVSNFGDCVVEESARAGLAIVSAKGPPARRCDPTIARRGLTLGGPIGALPRLLALAVEDHLAGLGGVVEGLLGGLLAEDDRLDHCADLSFRLVPSRGRSSHGLRVGACRYHSNLAGGVAVFDWDDANADHLVASARDATPREKRRYRR